MADRDEWMRRLGPLYPGAVAIRQTTVMRWPGGLRATTDDSERAAPWMVVVGAVLGVAAWGVAWVAGVLDVPVAVRGALAVLALTALTAALLDVGLARAVERWSGRDPGALVGDGDHGPIGPAGTSVLLAVALTRVVAVIAIRPSAWLAALVVAPLLGRWAALALQRLGDVLEPPAPDRRSLVVGGVSWLQLGVVTALVGVVAVLGLGAVALVLLAMCGAIAFVAGLVVERARGGLDGHSLAAVAAACEVLALVGIAAIAPALVSPWSA